MKIKKFVTKIGGRVMGICEHFIGKKLWIIFSVLVFVFACVCTNVFYFLAEYDGLSGKAISLFAFFFLGFMFVFVVGLMQKPGNYYWIVFIAIILVFVCIFGFCLYFLPSHRKIISLIVFFYFVLMPISVVIFLGWVQVPHKHEWIVEKYGKYLGYPLEAGIYLIFPISYFLRIKYDVYLAQEKVDLFMDDENKKTYGKRNVDFKDASAPVVAICYVTIKDSAKSVYGIASNVFGGIADKVDEAIRSYLASYKLNNANKLKIQFDLCNILNNRIIVEETEAGKIARERAGREKGELPSQNKSTSDFFEKQYNDAKEYNGEVDLNHEKLEAVPWLWKEIRSKWGVSLDSIVVKDIEIPEYLMKARAKELKAEADAKASKHEAEKITILADAEKMRLKLVGEGFASQIEILMASKENGGKGFSREQAYNFLLGQKKWESAKSAGKAVFIEDGTNKGVASNATVLGTILDETSDKAKEE